MASYFEVQIGVGVARGLASRQRLKLSACPCSFSSLMSRQGIGFSSEIETTHIDGLEHLWESRQGIGFSSEIETFQGPVCHRGRGPSPGDWLLVRD